MFSLECFISFKRHQLAQKNKKQEKCDVEKERISVFPNNNCNIDLNTQREYRGKQDDNDIDNDHPNVIYDGFQCLKNVNNDNIVIDTNCNNNVSVCKNKSNGDDDDDDDDDDHKAEANNNDIKCNCNNVSGHNDDDDGGSGGGGN
eukprot:Pgem_evm1s12556